MGRARAMTTFTAHSALQERRRSVAVLSAVDVLHTGRVALEASGRNGSSQKRICIAIVARRKPPGARAAVVCGGCFVEKPIDREQIAPSDRTGSNKIGQFT